MPDCDRLCASLPAWDAALAIVGGSRRAPDGPGDAAPRRPPTGAAGRLTFAERPLQRREPLKSVPRDRGGSAVSRAAGPGTELVPPSAARASEAREFAHRAKKLVKFLART